MISPVAALLAHGSNLDEVGLALALLLGIGALAAIAWVGGRRDKERNRDDSS